MNLRLVLCTASLGILVALAPGALTQADATRISDSAAAQSQAASQSDTVHLPQTGKLVHAWEIADPRGDAVPHYSITRDGQVLRSGPTQYEIHLRYADFDPLHDGPPAIPPILSAGGLTGGGVAGEGMGEPNEIYIVQFITQPLTEYRMDITDLGGTIYKFLANHSYIVRMSDATRDAVAALPYVRWIGELHPAYRLEEFLVEGLTSEEFTLPSMRYYIHVFERGPAQKDIVADKIRQLGGVIDHKIPDGFLLEATLSAEQLLHVAHFNEVMFIDRWGPSSTDMDIAREIGGGNYVEVVAGYTGQGVRAEVMDSNLMLSHLQFQNPPALVHGNLNGSTSHGTRVFGTIFSTGLNNSPSRGMMPDAQGIFASYSMLNNRYQHTAELLEAPFFAVFQTNSWGGQWTVQYSNISAEMDDILLLNDITILQSQSNTGNQSSRPQAWAKNIVSLGGVRHLDTLTKSDDFWQGASVGPAADGRVKPDLTHFYDHVYTTNNNGGYHATFGGTSAATPITAGHFGLMYQMWSEGIFGNEVDENATVFENRPRQATAKALMINTAAQYPFATTNLTRARQGWGMVDVKNLYDARETMYIIDGEDVLQNLDTTDHVVVVEPGTDALRATLVYTDPAGVPNSSVHRINAIVLQAVSPSGTTYWGNNGLWSNNWSTSGGSPNLIDTVQNVFVENPEAGKWTITVHGMEINENAYLATPEVDAAYGLVVSGVAPAPKGIPGDLTGNGVVGVADLLILLGEWGDCGDCGNCPADLTGSCSVGVADLLILLGNWG